MSSTPQNPAPNPTPSQTPATTPPRESNEVVVYSHSNIFYWWPVWALGFIMSIVTLIDGHLMATVPSGTKAMKVTVTEKDKDGKEIQREAEVLVLPDGKHITRAGKVDAKKNPDAPMLDPSLRMANNKNLGVIFCILLALVILITNVPLRGMWSVIVIVVIILMSIIFALADLWERIFDILGGLDIRINMGGYLFISTVLFVIWLVALLFFDRQVYMVFTPGQFKVCTEIGGGERVFDTMGLTLERQKGDIFRHYILGLGSGDLVVKTTGAQALHFDMPNVLFINKKARDIEELLKKAKVIETK
jgi:hypothetical protein